MADLVQLPAQPPLQRRVHPIARRAFRVCVHGSAIRPDDRRDVDFRLHPPLDLEAANAALHQPRQVLHHADVPAGENRRSPLVLLDGHGLLRPRPLVQGVGPAARLAARAAVRAPPVQKAGKHAASGIRHAGRAVDERLQLDFVPDRRAHRLNLLKRHLPRQHDALCPQRLVYAGGFAVRRARLRAHVHIQPRHFPRNPRNRAEIGDNRRVHADVARPLRRPHHAVEVTVKGEDVQRQVHLRARRMRQPHGLFELFFVEIVRLRAQAVLFCAR